MVDALLQLILGLQVDGLGVVDSREDPGIPGSCIAEFHFDLLLLLVLEVGSVVELEDASVDAVESLDLWELVKEDGAVVVELAQGVLF